MLVGVGVFSALTLGFAELMRSSLVGQQKILQIKEISDLKNEMGILLDIEANCRNSLVGPCSYGQPTQPVPFKKTEIDEDEEGLPVELYVSSQDGNSRGPKIFSATESPLNQYGSLTIKSIKVLMNKEGVGSDYSPDDQHSALGTLRVKIQIDPANPNQERSFDIRMSVWLRTEADGQITFLSCSRSLDSSPRCSCVLKTLLSSPSFKPDTCNYGDIFKREEQF